MIKTQLFDIAKSIGIDKIGITKDGSGMTIIAALFPYYVSDESGNVAMYARGRDYHKVNSEKLKILCKFLNGNGAKVCSIFVDNAARNDREAANHAGLAFWGRNNILINDEYGSYFTIGQIVTDLSMEPDFPDTRTCQNCGECAKACPSGGLSDGKYDKSICISDISQKKGKLTAREEELLKSAETVWGCDICLTVCPHNENLVTTALPELMENRITNLVLRDIDSLTAAEFLEKYQQYAFAWRGVDVVKRNLKILQKCNK